MVEAARINGNQGKPVRTMMEILGLSEDFFTAPPHVAKEPAPASLPAAGIAAGEAEAEVIVLPKPALGRRWLSRDVVRYPLIFLAAFGFFYLLLNFQTLFKQTRQAVLPPPPASKVGAAVASGSDEYKAWLKKYYVHENAPQILTANEDPDKDGLANGEEFLLKTNPLKTDTDEDAFNDGREVLSGYNPLYDGKQRPWQQELVAEVLERDKIAARQNFEAVAGSSTGSRQDQSQGPSVDLAKPGTIRIPRLNLVAPIIWSREVAKLEQDLKNGAVHHPETPFPGSKGTASIHGHSSGFPWDGDYKTVFAVINTLEPGDEIIVSVTDTGGKEHTYRYLVRSKGVFAKNDTAQFAGVSDFGLNISTSWPIGTSRQRFVVKAELVGL